jgi:hypothetical protein
MLQDVCAICAVKEDRFNMNFAVIIGWLALAFIHATPALALIRPALLTKLYGIKSGSGLFIFMHHRAALFLVVIVICLWAVIDPNVRKLASVTLGISMGAFVILWWQAGSPAPLRTIAVTDVIGLIILFFVGWQAFSATA